MAPKKKVRITQGVGTFGQAPQRPTRASRASTNAKTKGNASHPYGLTHPDHIARYNSLNGRVIVHTCFYDEDLLNQLGLLNDIRLLFARGGVDQFIKMKVYTNSDLTLELLSTLHVEVT